eukprot:gene16043-21778_t
MSHFDMLKTKNSAEVWDEVEEPYFLVSSLSLSVKPLDDSFLCPLCLELMTDPVQCRNGHLFCRKCILLSLSIKESCPTCRLHLSVDSLSTALIIKNYIHKTLIKCCHHKLSSPFIQSSKISELSTNITDSVSTSKEAEIESEIEYCGNIDRVISSSNENVSSSENRSDLIINDQSFGCEWIGTADQLSYHLKYECSYKLTTCKHINCPSVVHQKLLDKHLMECDYRPVECDYCNTSMKVIDLISHYKICNKMPMLCINNCNTLLPRNEIVSHMKNDCLLEPIQCPLYHFMSSNGSNSCKKDCKGYVLRKDLNDHIFEKNNITSTVISLINRVKIMEKQQEENRNKIDFLSSSLFMLLQSELSHPNHSNIGINNGNNINNFQHNNKFSLLEILTIKRWITSCLEFSDSESLFVIKSILFPFYESNHNSDYNRLSSESLSIGSRSLNEYDMRDSKVLNHTSGGSSPKNKLSNQAMFDNNKSIKSNQTNTYYMIWELSVEEECNNTMPSFILNSPTKEIMIHPPHNIRNSSGNHNNLSSSASIISCSITFKKYFRTISAYTNLVGYRGDCEYSITIFRFGCGPPHQFFGNYHWRDDIGMGNGCQEFIDHVDFFTKGFVSPINKHLSVIVSLTLLS